MNRLATLGNIPVTSAVIASLYPDIMATNKKVAKLESEGRLIRLKRGLYVVSPSISGCRLSTGLMANDIYFPSYVSMHTALRHYELIPETVFTTQSMTIKHSRSFENVFGRFEYTHVSMETFPIGLTQHTDGKATFVIATPEKALCDLIAFTGGLSLRYKVEAVKFLEDDLRLDMDWFETLDKEILEQYVMVGKKPESIRTILKLLS